MGYNINKQLGIGKWTQTSSQITPAKMQINPYKKKVRAISAGEYHCLMLLENGVVWGVGDNRDRQLGNDPTQNFDIPVQLIVKRQDFSKDGEENAAETEDSTKKQPTG